MTFTVIMSVILVFAGVGLFVSDMGRVMPIGIRLVPFIELGLLWLMSVARRTDWINTAFLVQFWILFVVLVVPGTVGAWTLIYLDREHHDAPVTYGQATAAKELVLVYHPGASAFPAEVMRLAGQRLAAAGYKVTVYAAHRGVEPDLTRAQAVGLSSPVYGGTVRPPLRRYVERADLSGHKCFVMLVGTEPLAKAKDLDSIVPLVQGRGGQIIATGKILQGKEAPAPVEQQVNDYCQKLLATLGQR